MWQLPSLPATSAPVHLLYVSGFVSVLAGDQSSSVNSPTPPAKPAGRLSGVFGTARWRGGQAAQVSLPPALEPVASHRRMTTQPSSTTVRPVIRLHSQGGPTANRVDESAGSINNPFPTPRQHQAYLVGPAHQAEDMLSFVEVRGPIILFYCRGTSINYACIMLQQDKHMGSIQSSVGMFRLQPASALLCEV